eukprot:9654517-Lingulodinium_polyedra.AAC.1
MTEDHWGLADPPQSCCQVCCAGDLRGFLRTLRVAYVPVKAEWQRATGVVHISTGVLLGPVPEEIY